MMSMRTGTRTSNSLYRMAALVAAAFLALSPAFAADVGDIPPDELGNTDGGKDVRLSDSEGRIRIVTFWATWCPPCLKELPVLNAIQNQAGTSRVQVIAINLKESRRQYRKAREAFTDFNVTFVHDARGKVGERFGVKAIPYMLIIDVDGRVAYKHVGYDDSELENIVGEINTLLTRNNLGVP